MVEAKFSCFQFVDGPASQIHRALGLWHCSSCKQVHLGWQVGDAVFLFSRHALLADEGHASSTWKIAADLYASYPLGKTANCRTLVSLTLGQQRNTGC